MLDSVFKNLDLQQIASTFIVLFAIIDVLGSTPIFIDQKKKGRPISAVKAVLISTVLLVGFFYAGDAVLRLFNVDIESFAVAGSLVLFLVGMEMILDVEIFKFNGPLKEATLIPVVFPLLVGAGALTAIISLRAEYAAINILIGLGLNMLVAYAVLSSLDFMQRYLSQTIVYVMRKFFGVIVIAIAVRLFTVNLLPLINNMPAAH